MNDDCGCCTTTAAIGPQPPVNRPGLSALAYRLGTHASFLAAMDARLSASDFPALAGLTTRDPSDPAVAILDAWATVADVLCFYQERIANEGYLRTATEQRSIQELVWLVGYRLRPGVAASVYLAYTLDPDAAVTILAGSRAQSVPGPGEQMQSFETSEDLAARADWNTFRPRTTQPTNLTPAAAVTKDALYVQGITTNLNPNDRVLFVFDGPPLQTVLRVVDTVEPDANANRTRVALHVILDAATFIDRVGAAVAGYVRQEPDVGASSATITTLNTLQTAASAAQGDTGAKSLYQAVLTALPALQDQRDQAIAAGNLALQNWLNGIVTGLEQLAAWIDPKLAIPPSQPGTRHAPPLGNSFNSLPQLAGALTQPPAAPSVSGPAPAGGSYGLSSGTDDVVQLLIEMHPDLDPQALYTAWGNAVTAPPPAFTVYALRQRAAVFGNNAPKRPIVVNGQITGYQEWTLTVPAGAPTALFAIYLGIPDRISIFAATTGTPPAPTVQTTVQLDGAWGTGTLSDSTRTLTLGKVEVKLNPPTRDQSLYTLTYTFKRDDLGTPAPALTIIPAANQVQVIPGDADAVTITNTATAPDGSFVVSGQLRRQATKPTEVENVVSLDASYPQILAGSWVILEKPNAVGPQGEPPQTPTKITPPVVARADAVSEGSRADYGITAKGTQIILDRPWLYLTAAQGDVHPLFDTFDTIRKTTVFAQSEVLELAPEPIDPVAKPVSGDSIELDRLIAGLTSGRWLVVSGERVIPGTSGVNASELVILQSVKQGGVREPGDATHSTLVLANSLAYTYKADTVTISGNVVNATHGETKKEVLGGGDSSEPFQSFTLSQGPLTYAPADTPTGVQSTLQVSVNDVVWHEVDSLLPQGPTDHVYTTRADDKGKATITFGDGIHGARLPTGAENVQAVYRVGIGQAGDVQAGQISLLATRPLGVRAVVNPQPATGGADRDDADSVRRNVALGAAALGRLVSVADYGDFARAFAGVGKASASRRAVGRRQVIHLAIVGANGIPIAPDSDLVTNLGAALSDFGDPSEQVDLVVGQRLIMLITAQVFLQPDYLWEGVEPKVRAALEDTFAFDRRDLGQPAFLSEAVAAVQDVEGIQHVVIQTFQGISEDELLSDVLTHTALPEGIADHERIAPGPDALVYVAPAVPGTILLNLGTA